MMVATTTSKAGHFQGTEGTTNRLRKNLPFVIRARLHTLRKHLQSCIRARLQACRRLVRGNRL